MIIPKKGGVIPIYLFIDTKSFLRRSSLLEHCSNWGVAPEFDLFVSSF